MFVGTVLNAVTIIIGSILGVLMGAKLSVNLRETITAGLGLFTFGYGLISFIETGNPLIPLGGLLIGALLGEWWRIEEGLAYIGLMLRNNLTRTLVFVIGPIAILGSIQNGLTGNFELLAIKAILDGFASIAFASTLGIGVAFSALSIVIYQGIITLLAGFFSNYISPAMMTEMTSAGGLILMSIAISSLLTIKKIRSGSYLPALIITPLIVLIIDRFFGGI